MFRYVVMAKLTWFHLNREISCHSSAHLRSPFPGQKSPHRVQTGSLIYGQGPAESINLSAAGNVPYK